MLRIIGGKHRSRKIPIIEAQGLRPTSDRIRETVFNWLAALISSSKCLDLYAGTGALGFEAASRGAANVVMVEKQVSVFKQLQDNIKLLKTDNVLAVHSDAIHWLDTIEDSRKPFDIVFLDPPFGMNLVNSSIEALISNNLLALNAMVYVEQEVSIALPDVPQHWNLHREAKAGQVRYMLFKV